jgi:hypothetical protein
LNKLKITILLFCISLLAILTFSLSKSWFFLDRGINLAKEETGKEETVEKEIIQSDEVERESRVIWKSFIYYPTELIREDDSSGPQKILHHARNLTFINLNNGKLHKVFEKKVYIYDYIPGDFSKTQTSFSTQEEITDTIDIGNKFIILVMTIDTNKDGYLNYKDKARIFIYDPLEEKLSDILPENYFYEKILLNTKKNTLAFIVKKLNQTKKESYPSQIFLYDSLNDKGLIIVDDEK